MTIFNCVRTNESFVCFICKEFIPPNKFHIVATKESSPLSVHICPSCVIKMQECLEQLRQQDLIEKIDE